jgi:replicative DNA helicase
VSATIQPSAVEAERAIIGAILIDPPAVNQAVDLLSAEDFYREPHRIIFESVAALVGLGRTVDLIALADHLTSRGELDRVGGFAALGEMGRETSTSANIETHCRLVIEKAQLRRLLDATERIRQSVTSSALPADEVLENAEREIFQVSTRRSGGEPLLISTQLAKTFQRIDELSELKGRLTGVTTGYPDLNEMTSGFQRSDMIIIAGRPSMGKTSLAMNMMEAVALEEKKPVVFFSLEMGIESVIMRFLSSVARVSFKRIRNGRLSDEEMTDLGRAADKLQRSKLYIDDASSLTPLELRSRCRRIASRAGPLGLIAVDYLQLMNTGRKVDNRVQEVSEISRTLKSVARELEVPMLVLSQLSRAPAQRADHKPQLSDLRDSGAIEQDADLVAFVHREDYAGAGGSGEGGEAELLVRKHRNGETGAVRLVFIGEIMRFESSAGDSAEDRETAVIG